MRSYNAVNVAKRFGSHRCLANKQATRTTDQHRVAMNPAFLLLSYIQGGPKK